MANTPISGLPPVSLPIDDANSFLEVTVTEAGEEVSRKITIEEIAGQTGLDASFLTVSANAQLPNERVLTEGTGISFVDTGPNGTLTINASGVTFPLLAPDGSAAAPSYSFAADTDMGMFRLGAFLAFTVGGTAQFGIDSTSLSAIAAGGPLLRNFDSTATVPNIITDSGDIDTGLGSAGPDILSQIAGGVEITQAINGVNNQFAIAQSGSSSVPDLTSLADLDTGFRWPANNETVWIGGGSRAWNFSTVKFYSQFSNGPGLFNRVSDNDVVTVAPDHSDDNTGLGANNDKLSLIAGGVEGVRVTEAAAAITVDIFGALNATGVTTFTDDVAFRDGGDIELFDATNTIRVLLTALTAPDIFRINGAGDFEFFDVQGFNTSMRLIGGISLDIDEIGVVPGTPAAGSGQFWVRNDVPNVPMFTDDDGVDWVLNAAAVSPDPLQLSSGGVGVPSYSFSVDTDTGMYNPGADLLGFTAGGVLLAQVDGSAAGQFLVGSGTSALPGLAFLNDPDTGVVREDTDRLALVAGGVAGVMYQESASTSIQAMVQQDTGLTASVTQTQAGGLVLLSSYNEISTVANSGDALTMQGAPVTAGVSKLVTIVNNGANDLQLFPSSGDDLGAGVDASIVISAGSIGIFIGRDSTNWDTLTGGDIALSDLPFGDPGEQYTTNEAGTAMELQLASKYLFVRKGSAGTITAGTPVYISGYNLGQNVIEVEEADASVAGTMPAAGITFDTVTNSTSGRCLISGNFEDIDTSSWSVGDAIYVSETTGLLTNVKPTGTALIQKVGTVARSNASNGQLVVQGAGRSNDLPNLATGNVWVGDGSGVPVETAGAVLPAGTIGDSSIKWDGVSAWVEETQVAFPGGATGIKVFDGTLADFITMGHNGSTAGFSVNGATTEVIFGQGGGPTTAWRFNEMVRVPDGSAAVPGLTWFGDITTGIYRHVLGLSVSITGVEQLRVSNATTQIYSDDFRLQPNIGADSIIMRVNPVSDANDMLFTLASLVDIHWRGTGLERFVLEEPNLAMVEKAAAPGDVAGVGQFWVRDDSPNVPMFTDDTGTDFVLNAGGGGLDNDACQARRTTVYALTTAFVDITMDVTDIETDSAVIDHDLATNSDNIIFGADGTYEVTYDFDVICTAVSGDPIIDMGCRVRLNDAGTGINGSLANPYVFRDGSVGGDNGQFQVHVSNTFIVTVSATDFITLQLDKTELSGSATFNASKICVKARRLL